MKIYQLIIKENKKIKNEYNLTTEISNIKNAHLTGTIIRRGIIKNTNKKKSTY